ncbi:PRC-barrel domain-containing protein [Cyanobacteria bacterium FACHB-DQ100]|nr:PRC-barrel domain-containing protein [Cyanobacteria bacterium FACHB-DQ100]
MRKGSDIIGRTILAFDTGKRVARVQDLIFDQDTNQLLGILVQESGLFHSAKVVPLEAISAFGSDTLIIPTKEAIISTHHDERIHRVFRRNIILKGTRIVTTDGRYLGSVVDLFFDEQTGAIEGYETSGGIFADAYSGRSFIPAPQTIRIGRDVTFVPPETAELMEEQVGGIRGAMQSASARIQEGSEAAGQSIQTAAQSTQEQLQRSAEAANTRLQAATTTVSNGFENGTHSATTTMTNQLVDPDEQFAYVIGKTVDRDIYTDDGQLLIGKDQVITLTVAEAARYAGELESLYRAAGGSLTAPANRQLHELGERVQTGFQEVSDRARTGFQTLTQRANETFSTVTARFGVEQAKGRRADRMIRADSGAIIAAPGQIVTDIVIQRAKATNRETALLDAVGLHPTEAVRGTTNDSLAIVRTRLRNHSSIASSRLHQEAAIFQEEAAIARENAKTLWHDLKERIAEYQGRSASAIHRNRVEHALGRPVNRVILDRQDNVILNVGEIITHKAIEQAEASGVINILLNSVYSKEPTIREEELRAPEPGMASLEQEHAIHN